MTLDLSEFASLTEEEKSFVDDMRDEAIHALARKPYNRYALDRSVLYDKHGIALRDLNPDQMWAIGRYCQYLIEIGAVKSTPYPTKDDDPVPHVDHLTYYSYPRQ